MEPKTKYVTYSKTALANAVDMARRGVSIRKSAASFGVPEPTVRRKLKLQKLRSPGKPTVLSKEEEKSIIEWICLAAQSGFPVNAQWLQTSVGYFLRISGKSNPFTAGIPGRKWLKLFLRRHPEISRRVPSALSKQRTTVAEKPIRNWFNEVGSFIDKQQLRQILEKPECIFNMDESAVRMVPTKEHVFAKTGEKYVHTNNGNSEKESYTALFAANAAGTLAPPMVLFPYKQRLPAVIAQNAPSGWSVGRNQSGWMTRETFLDYLKKVFVPWVEEAKIPLPIVIFVDGHTSHVSYETIDFCRSHQITLISLYPNATHVLQPLDVAFFRPLKVQWNKRLIEYRTFHAGQTLPKHEIAPLLKKAVDDIKNMKTVIMNGFRKCGIVPWNPNAVNYGILLKGQTSSTAKDTREAVEPGEQDSRDITEAQPGAQHCLQYLESCLKVGQLKMFEKHQSDSIWPGPVGDTNLFYTWQDIKKKANLNLPADDPDEFHGFETNDVEEDRINMLQWKDTVGSSWDTTTQQTGNITELTGTAENVEESLVNGNLKEETVTGISKNPANIKILRQQPVNQNSTEDPKSPSQALSSLSLAGMKQNLFSVAFTLPKATPKPPKDRKRPRPPAVATSDEYRAWFQKIELDKKEEEQIRAEKKAARDAKKVARDVKKAASALRLKAKSKAGPKRAKLVI